MDDLAVTVSMNSEIIDIGSSLPFDRAAQMAKFASDDDGLLDKRKEALVRRIYSSCDLSSVPALKDSLCINIFTKQCLSKLRWPHARYMN